MTLVSQRVNKTRIPIYIDEIIRLFIYLNIYSNDKTFWLLTARATLHLTRPLRKLSHLPYILIENIFFPFRVNSDRESRQLSVPVRTVYANYCNSCLLIISASISRSKPPANADRTLSLSRSPHFAPLYCSTPLPGFPLFQPPFAHQTCPFVRGVYKRRRQ